MTNLTLISKYKGSKPQQGLYLCVCGNYCDAEVQAVKSGRRVSCGHCGYTEKPEVYPVMGDRNGRCTLIGWDSLTSSVTALCDCGNIFEFKWGERANYTKGCGCSGLSDPSLTKSEYERAFLNRMIREFKNQPIAGRRKLIDEWNPELTPHWIRNFFASIPHRPKGALADWLDPDGDFCPSNFCWLIPDDEEEEETDS